MFPNARLMEMSQIVAGFGPVDPQSAANNGDWVSMKYFNRLLVLFFKAAGTAGDDPTLTLKQATDVSGAGAKALTFTDIYVKQGTLASVGTFTKTTQAATNTYTDATSAEVAAIWAVEVKADELDINNDFDCVQVSVADVGGNAQLGAALYILYDPKYGVDVPSAIAD